MQLVCRRQEAVIAELGEGSFFHRGGRPIPLPLLQVRGGGARRGSRLRLVLPSRSTGDGAIVVLPLGCHEEFSWCSWWTQDWWQKTMAKGARRKRAARRRGEWVKSKNPSPLPYLQSSTNDHSRILRNVTVASNLALHVENVEASRRRPLRA